MHFVIGLLGKCFAACVTFIRSLTRVNPPMQLHIPLEAKPFIANIALVWSLTSVGHHVSLELGCIVADHRTMLTKELLWFVGLHMILQ